MAEDGGLAAVVLGLDVGVSKAVVAYAPAGATSFGAELVRSPRRSRHAALTGRAQVPNETSSVTTPVRRRCLRARARTEADARSRRPARACGACPAHATRRMLRSCCS